MRCVANCLHDSAIAPSASLSTSSTVIQYNQRSSNQQATLPSSDEHFDYAFYQHYHQFRPAASDSPASEAWNDFDHSPLPATWNRQQQDESCSLPSTPIATPSYPSTITSSNNNNYQVAAGGYDQQQAAGPCDNHGMLSARSSINSKFTRQLSVGVEDQHSQQEDHVTKIKKIDDTSGAFGDTAASRTSNWLGESAKSLPILKQPPLIADYTFSLQLPLSTTTQCGEELLGYANKNQLYWMAFQRKPIDECIETTTTSNSTIKSVLIVSMRCPSSHESKFWHCWYSRQKKPENGDEPRAIEIDRQSCRYYNVGSAAVEYLSLNAVSIKWPTGGRTFIDEGEDDMSNFVFRLQLRLGCLSTDFCSQKGVKGLPIYLLVDTYENDVRVHRAYAQIKVFCDKGAERKLRNEAKKRMKQQLEQQQQEQPSSSSSSTSYYAFYSSEDVTSEPYLFYGQHSDAIISQSQDEDLLEDGQQQDEDNQEPLSATSSTGQTTAASTNNLPYFSDNKIVFYVRSKDEQAASSVELMQSQWRGHDSLKQALIEHYNLPADRLRHVTVRFSYLTNDHSDGFVSNPLLLNNGIFFVHCEQITAVTPVGTSGGDSLWPRKLRTASNHSNHHSGKSGCSMFDLHLIQLTATSLTTS